MSDCKHKWRAGKGWDEGIIACVECSVCGFKMNESAWLHLRLGEKDAEIATLKALRDELFDRNASLKKENADWYAECVKLRTRAEQAEARVEKAKVWATDYPDLIDYMNAMSKIEEILK